MTYSGQMTYGGGFEKASHNPEKEPDAYVYSGHLGTAIAVNRASDGATVAVIAPDGNLHPDYAENPLTQQWMKDVPDWPAVIAALEPESGTIPDS